MNRISFIAAVVMFLILLQSCAPDLSKYQYLEEPQITTMPKQKMLVVELQGDPNITGKKAFPALIKTFYKLDKDVRGKMSAPRARWPKPFDTPRTEWVGIYGLGVSEGVNELPKRAPEIDPKVVIEYWEYGEVAEILHIGSYSGETPTIEKLHKFIEDSGYKIVGPHEEEYLKGPGMFWKGNSKRYQTIIRYEIEKE